MALRRGIIRLDLFIAYIYSLRGEVVCDNKVFLQNFSPAVHMRMRMYVLSQLTPLRGEPFTPNAVQAAAIYNVAQAFDVMTF